jgi:hypothetical protein
MDMRKPVVKSKFLKPPTLYLIRQAYAQPIEFWILQRRFMKATYYCACFPEVDLLY